MPSIQFVQVDRLLLIKEFEKSLKPHAVVYKKQLTLHKKNLAQWRKDMLAFVKKHMEERVSCYGCDEAGCGGRNSYRFKDQLLEGAPIPPDLPSPPHIMTKIQSRLSQLRLSTQKSVSLSTDESKELLPRDMLEE